MAEGNSAKDLLPTPDELVDASKKRPAGQYFDRLESLLNETFILAKSRHFGKSPSRVRTHLQALATTLADGKGEGNSKTTEIVLHDWWRLVDSRQVSRYQLLLTFILVKSSFICLQFFDLSTEEPPHSPWLYMATFAANYLLLMMLAFRAALEKTSPFNLNPKQFRSVQGLIGAAIALICGLLIGGFAAAAFSLVYGLLTGASITMLGMIRVLRRPWTPAQAQRPSAVLRKDLTFSILFGTAFALFSTVYLIELLGPAMGFTLGVGYLLAAIASASMTRYAVALYISAHKGTPFRLARFLDWCCATGLMRISGTGYQFRHESLQSHLLRSS